MTTRWNLRIFLYSVRCGIFTCELVFWTVHILGNVSTYVNKAYKKIILETFSSLELLLQRTRFIPARHNMLFYALLTSLSTVCQGSVFLQFYDKIQHSNLACTKYSPTCIQVSIWPSYMESLTRFSQGGPPLKQCLPTFHHRTCSFCSLPIFSSLEPSKPLKSKFIFSPPRKRHQLPDLNNGLPLITVNTTDLKHIPNI